MSNETNVFPKGAPTVLGYYGEMAKINHASFYHATIDTPIECASVRYEEVILLLRKADGDTLDEKMASVRTGIEMSIGWTGRMDFITKAPIFFAEFGYRTVLKNDIVKRDDFPEPEICNRKVIDAVRLN